jgi:hypothetical protein
MASSANIVKGLIILAKYNEKSKEKSWIQPAHDEIYCGTDQEMSEEDKKLLSDLGFSEEDNEGEYSVFT